MEEHPLPVDEAQRIYALFERNVLDSLCEDTYSDRVVVPTYIDRVSFREAEIRLIGLKILQWEQTYGSNDPMIVALKQSHLLRRHE